MVHSKYTSQRYTSGPVQDLYHILMEEYGSNWCYMNMIIVLAYVLSVKGYEDDGCDLTVCILSGCPDMYECNNCCDDDKAKLVLNRSVCQIQIIQL